jgi:NAD(P)-dependent dehydrogenase (short-subunit alcohol dehydrogenase family)
MSLESLRGKVAIVTGAAGGIGSAVARRLSQEGTRVVAVDLDTAAAQGVVATLPTAAIAVGADVASADGVDRYMSAALKRFGRIDGVHLNAAYAGKRVALVDSEIEGFDKVMAVNVRGVYLGLRAAMRQLTFQAEGGAVVVTSSGAGLAGAQLFGPYAASKHAVIGLVRTAALEAARDAIRINVICPGFTDTEMIRQTEDMVDGKDRSRARAVLENGVPIGRYAEPDEMAACVAWLLSDEASYVTGATLAIDGGQTAGDYTPASVLTSSVSPQESVRRSHPAIPGKGKNDG